jgi:alcohol dehydrogenase
MKAARIHNYGGPDEVHLENADQPNPGNGQLLINVKAAGVNPIDWKVRAGYLQKNVPLQFPVTLGGDFSGVIEAVGKDVTGFEIGEEVFGQASVLTGGSGTFAESALASAETVAAKPKSIGFQEAAALPLVGVSALQALVENLKLEADQKILIHGGAGGIGSAAIQIAKHLGANVVTTAAGNDFEYVKSLGADQVIDYKNERFEEIVSDLDGVLDTVGGETYERSFNVLKQGGRIVSMIEQPKQELMDKYGVEALHQFTKVTTDRLRKLAELVDQGALKVNIDKTFPLEQAGEALQELETHSPRGKVVVAAAGAA